MLLSSLSSPTPDGWPCGEGWGSGGGGEDGGGGGRGGAVDEELSLGVTPSQVQYHA